MTRCAGVDFRTSFRMRMQSSTRFTGRKFERWISCFSFGRRSGSGWYRSQLTKLWITRISLATPKTSPVLLLQIFADGGDAVRFLDGEFRDRKVGAVRADQRDIGAVQRGDERQAPLSGHHLLRQQRGDRMRNRVVDVQQIEIVAGRDLGHARRQRQAVRRILKQRICRNFNFVIMNSREAGIEANGIRVSDEMNLVAARRQFQAELGGDNAAAAVGGITGDADLHYGRLPFRDPMPSTALRRLQ